MRYYEREWTRRSNRTDRARRRRVPCTTPRSSDLTAEEHGAAIRRMRSSTSRVALRTSPAGPRPDSRYAARDDSIVPLVIIVGGGIAGLSAAGACRNAAFATSCCSRWRPRPAATPAGATTRSSAFPWAAHYVPVPGRAPALVRELFEDLGVFDGTALGRAAPRATRRRSGCSFTAGGRRVSSRRWARRGATATSSRASRRGWRSCAPPAASRCRWRAGRRRHRRSTRCRWPTGCDREGLDSPWLRWIVDYACRDDYGARAATSSAWAGIHYFAAARRPTRPARSPGQRATAGSLRACWSGSADACKPAQLVYRSSAARRAVAVVTPRAALDGRRRDLRRAPMLVASRIVEGAPPRRTSVYSPWLTANLTLDRWPQERGIRSGVGQRDLRLARARLRRRDTPEPAHPRAADGLDLLLGARGGSPVAARHWLLAQDWSSLKDRILADLSRAHPDIRNASPASTSADGPRDGPADAGIPGLARPERLQRGATVCSSRTRI